MIEEVAPRTVTEAVLAWKDRWPKVVALPHPGPRNRIWVKKNPWFEEELLPKLRRRVRRPLKSQRRRITPPTSR